MDYDILLNVDKKAKVCYINTSDELIDVMKKTNIDVNKKITFSFTKKDDPHILYDMVSFDLTEKTKNCYIRSESKLVVGLEIEDLIIVETIDAVLVTRKESSQKVKDIVDLLKILE